MALSDNKLWDLWNAQGTDDMSRAEAFVFARAIEAEVRKEYEAQDAEIARLNKAIHYEQNYLTRIGTHGPDCWKWGPQHYQCALAEIARREAAAEIGKAMP